MSVAVWPHTTKEISEDFRGRPTFVSGRERRNLVFPGFGRACGCCCYCCCWTGAAVLRFNCCALNSSRAKISAQPSSPRRSAVDRQFSSWRLFPISWEAPSGAPFPSPQGLCRARFPGSGWGVDTGPSRRQPCASNARLFRTLLARSRRVGTANNRVVVRPCFLRQQCRVCRASQSSSLHQT
jgi:hypothetical protein